MLNMCITIIRYFDLLCEAETPRERRSPLSVKRSSERTNPASVLEAILGRQEGQREDTACHEDGVDVCVGVDIDAVVGVGVHGQGVNLGVSLGVSLVVGSPSGSPSEIWEFYDLHCHLPS